MVNNHLKGGSSRGILSKHIPDKAEQLLTYFDFALLHGLPWVSHEALVPLIAGLVEGLLSSDKHEEHHSACKNVNGRPLVLASLGSKKLWSHIVESSAAGL